MRNDEYLDKQRIFDRDYFDTQKKTGGLPHAWGSKRSYFETICATLKYLRPKRALDIGCAKGYLVSILNKNGIDAFGIDVSSFAIESSADEIKNKLYALDIENMTLPFEDGYFDLIIGLEVLEHLSEFGNIFRELNRVLREKGYIFFTTPTPDSWDAKSDSTHISIRPRKLWIRLFKQYGFTEAKKDICSKFKKEFIKNYKQNIDSMPPTRKIARFLLSLGWPGRILRREFQVYINFFSGFRSTEIFFLTKGIAQK